MQIGGGDLALVGTLILLEGLLSADNALVMAVMVLGLPARDRKKALSYGLIGGFAFRVVATLLAVYLMKMLWVKVAGGIYLLYLVYQHFFRHNDDAGGDRTTPPKAKPGFGLSVFWATVVRVELMNLAFSLDSILVAVGLSQKTWVVLSGGILGIIAMRVVVGQIMALVDKYPPLVDGAFVIMWVAVKLIADYAHEVEWVRWQIPQDLSLAVIFVIFGAAYAYARKKGPRVRRSED